jgi:hypothetical protein
MRVPFPCRPLRFSLTLFAAVTVAACNGDSSNPLEVNGAATARSSSIAVGQEIDIYMQNIGPGVYTVPPTLSGSAIEYLTETTPEPPDPGGVRQLFHFKGVASGTTIITFQSTGGFAPSTVVDTVNVR